MSKFIEIDQHLIDLDNINYCKYEINDKSYDDELYIEFKDGSTIKMVTNRFRNDAYEKHKAHKEGYEAIKKYLIKPE